MVFHKSSAKAIQKKAIIIINNNDNRCLIINFTVKWLCITILISLLDNVISHSKYTNILSNMSYVLEKKLHEEKLTKILIKVTFQSLIIEKTFEFLQNTNEGK